MSAKVVGRPKKVVDQLDRRVDVDRFNLSHTASPDLSTISSNLAFLNFKGAVSFESRWRERGPLLEKSKWDSADYLKTILVANFGGTLTKRFRGTRRYCNSYVQVDGMCVWRAG